MMLELGMFSPHSAAMFYIGTMGFGYDDWCDVFYPAMMPARKYLAYYSRIFNAVEIDLSVLWCATVSKPVSDGRRVHRRTLFFV